MRELHAAQRAHALGLLWLRPVPRILADLHWCILRCLYLYPFSPQSSQVKPVVSVDWQWAPCSMGPKALEAAHDAGASLSGFQVQPKGFVSLCQQLDNRIMPQCWFALSTLSRHGCHIMSGKSQRTTPSAASPGHQAPATTACQPSRPGTPAASAPTPAPIPHQRSPQHHTGQHVEWKVQIGNN